MEFNAPPTPKRIHMETGTEIPGGGGLDEQQYQQVACDRGQAFVLKFLGLCESNESGVGSFQARANRPSGKMPIIKVSSSDALLWREKKKPAVRCFGKPCRLIAQNMIA